MSKYLSNSKPFLGWSLVVTILLVPLLNLFGAVDMFLRLDGIEGEADDTTHANEIDVLAWSWGASNSGSAVSGAGTGNVQDLSLTKYLDKSSPDLLLKVLDGKHIANGTLTVRKAGATALEYLVIDLTDIIVSSYSTGGSGGEDKLTENVSLNFGKVTYTYFEDSKTSDSVSWDVGKGVEF